jgi:UDP-MurNAc hydroxylase
MKVTHIADSTFVFEHNGTRLLTDPWIGTTIYGGAWMQYPAPTVAASDVGDLDWIFISHIHEDHCDPATLKQLDRRARVLLLDRSPNLVEAFLGRQGLDFAEVVNVSAYEPFEIAPGLFAHALEADPTHELNHLIDSALLLSWGTRDAVLFCNDTSPHPEMIEYVAQFDLQLALLPASGGSGYPACFTTLSADDKAAERTRIVRSYFDSFAASLDALMPRRFLACAGNHVVSGRNWPVNEHLTFLHDPAEAYRHAAHRLSPELAESCVPVALDEGTLIDLDIPIGDPLPWWERALQPRADGDRDRFLVDVASHARYDHDDNVALTGEQAARLFALAAPKVLARMQGSGWRSHLYLRLPDGQVGHLDPFAREWSIEPAEVALVEPHLVVSAEPNLLGDLLTGRFSWNIADASCFLAYERRPNVYDPEAVIALNHLTAPCGFDPTSTQASEARS